MEQRVLGRTGIPVSILGFGCGAVGGLMVRGEPSEQERVVARALEIGITLFDTAPMYGNGASETNLGRVLARLRPEIVLTTKFALDPASTEPVARATRASLEASLRRLGRESIDVLQCHNMIGPPDPAGRALAADVLLGEVVETLGRLKAEGKIRAFGITGLGDTRELLRIIDSGACDTVQVAYSLLNSSAGGDGVEQPAQDFEGLAVRAAAAGMGRIGIRAIAGGALSGTTDRHPLGMPDVSPIATGADYAADATSARSFESLVRDSHAATLVEAAIRFAITGQVLSVVLVGYSTMAQLEAAAAAVDRGPFPPEVLAQIRAIQHGLKPTV